MKLLQINGSANYGSVGKDAEGIGKAAIERGWESYIAYSRKMNPSISKLINIGNKWDNYCHGIKARIFDADGLGSKHATKNFIKVVDGIDPDLIILHNIHGYFLNYPLLFQYLQQRGTQVIWSLHDCWPFTGHCAYFVMADCMKWQNECNHCSLLNTYPVSWGYDGSCRNFRFKKKKFCSLDRMKVVAVSDWLKGLVGQSFLNIYPISRIYNGVNTEIFKFSKSGNDMWPGKKILMGVAEKWTKRKGLFDYIRLAQKLPKEYMIVLVGHIESNSFVDSLPPNILHIDRIEGRREIAKYYTRADISMNLSYQETLGLTTIEAMACGTPCIVYNATASPELVTPDTGLVVKVGDIEDILKAIKILSVRDKASYSGACRKRVLDCFDEMTQFAKYLELYDA